MEQNRITKNPYIPLTNVAQFQIPASTPYVGWIGCWSPLLREVFSKYSSFSHSTPKPTVQ